MRRLTSLVVVGKSHLSSPSFLHLYAAALHTRHLIPPPSSRLFNLTRVEVIRLLGVKCKIGFDGVDDARNLFFRMLEFQPLPCVDHFNRLLTGVVKMKQLRTAVLLYREMLFHGVPVDEWTMSIVLNCFCNLNQVDFGFAILAGIFKLGFKPNVITLTTLVHGLFEAGSFVEAMELFRIMVIQEACDETTYGTVISGLCKSGNTSKAIELLRLVEKEGHHKPNFVMYCTIVDCLCKDKNVDEALELLSEMAANPANIITYRTVMRRLTSLVVGKSRLSSPSLLHIHAALHTRHLIPPPSSHLLNLTRVELSSVICKTGFDRVDDAHALFYRMLEFQPLPHVADFNRLLIGVVKMKQFSSAVLLYREMRFKGVPINEHTMTIVINCFCHLNQVDFGFAILAIIFKLGYKPDVVTLTTLMRGLFEAHRIAEAMKLFKIMLLQKVCSVTTYGTVINGLCKCRNTSKAIELLRLVEKEGHHKPNTVMYSAIVDSLFKDRKVDEALQLLSEMAANATPANIITYNSVIQGLCNLGRWKDVTILMTEMANTRIYPDVVTFTMLVDAFSKEGSFEEAENILKIMVERGQHPDVVTYNALMDGYCLRGEMDRAHQVLQTMVAQGCHPDIQSYTILVNGHCKKGNLDDALDLFKVISCIGMKCNAVLFNTMIQGLFEVGRCVDARELINEMQSQGVSPDSFTHCIWVDGLCQNGLVSEAHTLLCDLENNSVSVNIAAYNALIKGLFEKGEISSAKNLFDKLPSLGLEPNVRTFNAMLKGFRQEGLLEDTKPLLAKMREYGCLSDRCMHAIVQGLHKKSRGFGRWRKC